MAGHATAHKVPLLLDIAVIWHRRPATINQQNTGEQDNWKLWWGEGGLDVRKYNGVIFVLIPIQQ